MRLRWGCAGIRSALPSAALRVGRLVCVRGGLRIRDRRISPVSYGDLPLRRGIASCARACVPLGLSWRGTSPLGLFWGYHTGTGHQGRLRRRQADGASATLDDRYPCDRDAPGQAERNPTTTGTCSTPEVRSLTAARGGAAHRTPALTGGRPSQRGEGSARASRVVYRSVQAATIVAMAERPLIKGNPVAS